MLRLFGLPGWQAGRRGPLSATTLEQMQRFWMAIKEYSAKNPALHVNAGPAGFLVHLLQLNHVPAEWN